MFYFLEKMNYSFSFFNLFYKIYYTDFKNIEDNELDELKILIIDNGSISIKFMQWYISKLINTDEDPEKYKKIINKFSDIFDNCPFHSDSDSYEIFEKDFGFDLDKIIKKNSIKRIASGSIGQVYRATLIDGREIAIKVKHPYVDNLKNNQMYFINLLTQLQKYSYIRNNTGIFIDIEDFMENLNLQLDFKNEAFNSLIFSKNLKNNNRVIIPKVFYYSNNIIISEFKDGYYFHEIKNNYKRKKIAINFLCFNLESSIFNNFMHADLHSRNWKVEEDDKNSKIIIYDFGLCFRSISVENNIKVWESFQKVDLYKLLEEKEYFVEGNLDLLTYDDIKELNNLKKERFGMNILMKRMRKIFIKKNLKIKKNFMNLIIWITLIEDMIRETGCFIRKEYESDETQHQRATIIAYCNTNRAYDKVKAYYTNLYNKNTLTDFFNTENCGLVFDEI
tara:strand:- start:344 stop:1690 length:1347 start_codon:yes stop_codon:yes gene_type:complete